MRVRIKTFLPALAGLFLVGVAGEAAAQCCAPPPPPCCQPPPPPPPPPPSPPACCHQPPPPPCCFGGGNINVNVNVNANAAASSRARASAGTTVIVGGGGGAYFNVDQPYPTVIQNLNVSAAAAAAVVRVPYTETRRTTRRVVIQAVCIDDRNVPHPAAQVRPDREVSDSYDGELYRCIAGARLQVTIAEYLGQISFDGGEILACQKEEALYHRPGGLLECRRQIRERDCNERSLLRRYGAGVKILTIVREETITAYRDEVVAAEASAAAGAASIMLDGGVGGRVF